MLPFSNVNLLNLKLHILNIPVAGVIEAGRHGGGDSCARWCCSSFEASAFGRRRRSGASGIGCGKQWLPE